VQRFRRTINATEGNEFVLEHFIVDFDIFKMCKKSSAHQNMVEHLRTSVMQYGKASVGRQRPLDRCQYAACQMTDTDLIEVKRFP
jgi:hypothetical protein